MVDELISGTCIAIEIRGQDAHRTFREFTGPHDPVTYIICTKLIIYIYLI